MKRSIGNQQPNARIRRTAVTSCFVLLIAFLLTSCDPTVEDKLISIIEGTMTSFSLTVHQKEDFEVLIDISDTISYSLDSSEETSSLRVYEDSSLLFAKEYDGKINVTDVTPSLFEVSENFYYLVNRLDDDGTYICDLYEVSKVGVEEVILSKTLDFEGETYFYVDSHDDSFYFSYRTAKDADFTLDRYGFEGGVLSTMPFSQETYPVFRKGMKSVIHKSNGDIYVSTNGGEIYKVGVSIGKYYAGRLFEGDDGNVNFYYAFHESLDYSYYLSLRDIDDGRSESLKTLACFEEYLAYSVYDYERMGIFTLMTAGPTTSIENSIFSILLYNYESELMSAFYIVDERVSEVRFYGSKLYFISEVEENVETLSYIDFKDLPHA